MQAWHLWLLLAIGLLILESLTFTFFLAAMAVGAVAGAGAALLGASTPWQLAAFGAGTAIGFVGARRFVQHRLDRGDHTYRSNVDALPGREGSVIAPVGSDAPGLVLIDGDEWRATALDGSSIDAGRRVTVVEVRGNKLIVVETSGLLED